MKLSIRLFQINIKVKSKGTEMSRRHLSSFACFVADEWLERTKIGIELEFQISRRSLFSLNLDRFRGWKWIKKDLMDLLVARHSRSLYSRDTREMNKIFHK